VTVTQKRTGKKNAVMDETGTHEKMPKSRSLSGKNWEKKKYRGGNCVHGTGAGTPRLKKGVSERWKRGENKQDVRDHPATLIGHLRGLSLPPQI